MTAPVTVRVRVPASSANLGPGYDAFGLALALYDDFEAEHATEWFLEVTGEGAGELRTDGDNEVARAIQRVFAEVGHTGAARIRCENAIPLGRGLGSSAAAIVGGLVLGNELADAGLSNERLFELGAELEGHPDNVAAALFGGFTVCWRDGDTPRVRRIEPGGGLAAVVALSDAVLPTSEARQALPETVPHEDAAANVARASLVALGVALGDEPMLSAGLHDRIHEPYRAALIPDLAEIRDVLVSSGACGAALSGAGPTVIGFVIGATDDDALNRARGVADAALSRSGVTTGHRGIMAVGVERVGTQIVREG